MNRNMQETVDVLVVGSGFAGLSAAIEAEAAGASVLVAEKNVSTGGNSRISDGGIAAAGTALQEKYSITDSQELFYEDIMRSGRWINHPALVKVMVEKAESAFTWCRDTLQVPFLDRVDIFGGHSAARCYTPEHVTGGTIINKMLTRLTHAGVEIRTRTRLEKIRKNGEGRVTGAALFDEETGRVCEVSARKGLVIATGGFGADVRFRKMQDPRLDERIGTTNRAGSTAEVLKELVRIGGLPVQLHAVQLGPWASPDEKGFGHGPMFSEYIVFPYGIVVDPESGKRLTNELSDRLHLSDSLLALGHPAVGIADQKAVVQSGWDITPALKKGVVQKFTSLQDAAVSYGIPLQALGESIDRYNRFVTEGCDGDFGKIFVPEAAPVTEAPWYGIRLWPKVHHVSGGIAVDADTRVLDLNGNPIPGLFGAGEITGGIHGANRLGSCAVTECVVFGRIAGQNSASSGTSAATAT